MHAKLLIWAAVAVAAILPASAALTQGRSASLPACTAANARPMTIATIAAAGDSAVGTCVSVEGLVIGRQLQAGNDARYRPYPRANEPSSTGAILGLYGNTLPIPQRARAQVIGRVDSCERMLERAVAASGPNSIVMLGGYCHYYRGLAINATEVAAMGDADQVRIPRGTADPALGNLSPMAPGAARERLLAAANGLFAALRTPDVARALLRRSDGAARTDAEIFAMADRLAAGAGTRNGSGVTEIFGWRVPMWAETADRANFDQQAARVTEGIACHSARPDAAALWPISEDDAMLGGPRPYGCIRISINNDNVPRFDINGRDDEDYGIREP